MNPILDNLTEPQREAVTHRDGPMLVVAGAGSGKTRVVTRRIAHLIANGVWPQQILALTFTNKAANEMKERVAALVGEVPRWVSTFHSACARFLRRDIEALEDGRTGNYTIYDASDQKALVRQCMKSVDGCGDLQPGALAAAISRAKCAMRKPADVSDGGGAYDMLTGEVYALYEARLREANAVDFDDLLLLMVRILERRPDLRDVYHGRFRYLLVDEYQDTNHIQYRLMRLLGGPAENVHVTGDPDQSIYSWRGADYRNIMAFTDDYPSAKVVRLERNYRSTKKILQAANRLIRNNRNRLEKDLFTDKYEGSDVHVAACMSDREESRRLVAQVEDLRRDGVRLRDMAVFYRTNAQSSSLEDGLMLASIPYQIVGGIRFYERREIKDILAHLRLRINPADVVSLQRIAGCRPTGVGAKSLSMIVSQAGERGLSPGEFLVSADFAALFRGRTTAKLKAFASWLGGLYEVPMSPVGDAVYEMIRHTGLVELYERNPKGDPSAEDRLGNLNALIDRAYEFQQARPDATLHDFLGEVALVADIDGHDDTADVLSLMTLHSAKGLEFPYVFIVGVEEDCLPHRNSLDSDAGEEEERRLFYVGLTRAREQVTVSYALSRYVWGNVETRRPSRFLDELPEGCVTHEDAYALRETEDGGGYRVRGSFRGRGEWNDWYVVGDD